ncbi:MAG: SAM-dependent methyltransferase [Gaiellaceae bacterium]
MGRARDQRSDQLHPPRLTAREVDIGRGPTNAPGFMNCCSPSGYDEFFTDRLARRDARRFRRRGLDGTAAQVVRLARAEGNTILEVGGGVGAIQVELLRAGAVRAVNVELSPSYEPYAAKLLLEHGLQGRTHRLIGDFVERAGEVEPADVVVLHRVVCCYPDYASLVAAAADRARRQLLLIWPRDSWWMRLGIGAVNLAQRLRRRRFRVYLHPPPAILEAAASRGLDTTVRRHGLLWELAACERPRRQ